MSVDSDLAVPLPKSSAPRRNLTPVMWLGVVAIGIAVVSLASESGQMDPRWKDGKIKESYDTCRIRDVNFFCA